MAFMMDHGECDVCGGPLETGQLTGRCEHCVNPQRIPALCIITNQEFVCDLMDYSIHGPLTGEFIIDAIKKQAEYVLRVSNCVNGDAVPQEVQAWVAVAKEVALKANKYLLARAAMQYRVELDR